MRCRVGLVQVNAAFSGQHYFPYSVGMLQAYAQKYLPRPERVEFLLPIYRRVLVRDAVAQLQDADICCFSAYVWNVRLSLAIAKELKRQRPSVLVVFGGPQVPRPDRPWEVEAFLNDNPFVDLAVHGAGEKPFVSILEDGLSGNWNAIPSVSFLKDSALTQTERAASFKSLEGVPSPYVDGAFDALMAANPGERWIGLWETDRNCPFSCTFCGWGLLEKKPALWPLDQVYRDVDWFAEHKVEFVFCCNANFFLTARDLEIARYVVRTKLARGYPKFLSVQDAKNAADRVFEGRMILESAGLNTGVVISLQSIDPTTLQIIRRDNIRLDAYQTLQHRFRSNGIETMTDVILPLPGQTYDSFADGVSRIIDHGQHNRIQFNLCCSVPDAELSHRDYIQVHGLQTVTTKIVNIHGQVEEEEIAETQDLIIATAAMPREDWVRARTFSWMMGLLHFDKLLQIPSVVVRRLGAATYREICELFSEGRFGSAEDFPVLTRIRQFFLDRARDIQQGGTEYVYSPEWLKIYWPANEYMFIELAVSGKLVAFHEEAGRALGQFVERRGAQLPVTVLDDAIRLNACLLKKPFQTDDLEVELSTNVWEYYRGVILGSEVPLVERPSHYHIDRTTARWNSWEDWCREVVWWGNKRGAYLYGNTPQEQLAGHY